eukprot:612006-Amorphochlora_amoeboformis.AAC.1
MGMMSRNVRPVLWDKEEGVIVNNESEEILRMFNSEFKDFEESAGDSIDLCPSNLMSKIEVA